MTSIANIWHALLIEQESGARALKLASEVKTTSTDLIKEDEEDKDLADVYTEQAITAAAPIFEDWLKYYLILLVRSGIL